MKGQVSMEALLAVALMLAFAFALVQAQSGYSSTALTALKEFKQELAAEECALAVDFLYYNGGGRVSSVLCQKPSLIRDYNARVFAKLADSNEVFNVETFESYK